MVVLPETSNMNIWGDAVGRGIKGYQEGKAEIKSERKEAQKNALLAAITDPNKTPIERANAQEQFYAQFEPKELIKFQREQGRVKAMTHLQDLLQGGAQEQVDEIPVTGNRNPLFGPVSDSHLQNVNQPQQRKPTSPQDIEKALFALAEYDPAAANVVGGVLGRRQKEELANKNQDLKQQQFDFKKQEAEIAHKNENSKNLTAIQEKSMGAQIAAEKQLQSLDVIDELNNAGDLSALSKANLSKIVSGFENPIAQAIGRAIQSEAGAAFKTASKSQFAGLKDLWGAKPTEYETKVYSEMHADVGRSKEANDASLTLLKQPLQKEVERAKYTQQLIGEEPNIDPQTLNYRVFNHMNAYGLHLKKQYDKKVAKWVSSKKKPEGEPFKPVTNATGKRTFKEIYAPKK